MWIVLHLVTVSILLTIVWEVLQNYKHTPTTTVVDSYEYAPKNLDLPAVAMCTINRMSRRAVKKVAEKIISLNITNSTMNKMLDILIELGGLYLTSSEVRHYGNDEELNNILLYILNDQYDITELMKELTPSCERIIAKCRFRSKEQNCSELFSFRKTQDGFCCTFNYAREIDDVFDGKILLKNRLIDPYKIEKLDVRNGLSILLNTYPDDYFYTILPIIGWKITIFNPADYPDTTSGGVSEAIISPGTENYLELNAISFFSEDSIRRFDIDTRDCVFADEISALYEGYSYSDCIVKCKVDDIYERCNCRPFNYPKSDARRVCNTTDIKCLNKFNSKWWSVKPHAVMEDSRESNIFNQIIKESWSLNCNNCYPSCEDVSYSFEASNVVIDKEDTFFLKNDTIDQSVVHIFFKDYNTVRLKQDITYYWYELLSNIGGICGVFIGFSLISAIEFFYFVIISGVNLYKNNHKFNQPDDKNIKIPYDVWPIYWAELAPRSRY